MAKKNINLVVENCDGLLVEYGWNNAHEFIQAINGEDEFIPMLDDFVFTVTIGDVAYTNEEVKNMGWVIVKDLVEFLEEPKELNRISICCEHYDGSSYMGLELSIRADGSVKVLQVLDSCSIADTTEEDYLFHTDNDMIRVQANEPIPYEDWLEIILY